MLPNDEIEQDRLDLQHHIYRLMIGGKLYKAPLIPGNIQRALDFGTGTGIWALDFADENPQAIVIGTDLSPIQPKDTSPNCSFYVDDVESEWTFNEDEAFDYIHGRGMGGSISNWDELYAQCYQHLKPGGWIEMQEYHGWIYSQDDPLLTRCPNVVKWQHLCDVASLRINKRLNVTTRHKQWLIDAGFHNVDEKIFHVGHEFSSNLAVLLIHSRYQLVDGRKTRF